MKEYDQKCTTTKKKNAPEKREKWDNAQQGKILHDENASTSPQTSR